MRQTPGDTGDVPGHGRVGRVDDPVAPSGYGDDKEEIQDIQRDAIGDDPDARRRAQVYLLAYDDTERARDLRADPSTSLSVADLFEHYALAGEDDVLDLSDLWERWNRGSGRESRAFVEAQERSLSVGDVAILDGDAYRCTRDGWTSIELREVESE